MKMKSENYVWGVRGGGERYKKGGSFIKLFWTNFKEAV